MGSLLLYLYLDVCCVQHKADFQSMIECAKAGSKCKQLAISELPKYVSRFPDLIGLLNPFAYQCFQRSAKNR